MNKFLLNKRIMTFAMLIMSLVLGVTASFAQTPELVPDSDGLISAASSAMTTWNLWSFIIAFAVAGLALWVARKVKSLGR